MDASDRLSSTKEWLEFDAMKREVRTLEYTKKEARIDGEEAAFIFNKLKRHPFFSLIDDDLM